MNTPPPLQSVVDHLAWCRLRNLAPSTVEQRRLALGRLRRALLELGVEILDASTEDLEATMAGRPWEAASRATEIAHLRGFYRWAAWAGRIDVDPSIDLVRPKIPRGLPRPISDEDLAVALDLADRPVRTILMLAALAGLRAKEISGLRREHVLSSMSPAILLIASAKGGDPQTVPLHPDLEAELAEAMPRAGWLFPRLDGRPGPWLPHLISRRANDFLHHEVGTASTLHSLRHWFGSTTYRRSHRDLRATQELMRHRTPVSTAIYTWVDPGELTTIVHSIELPAAA